MTSEKNGKGVGPHPRRIDDASAVTLHAFITEAVEPGTRVYHGWL
jgi:hypothetical protein